ncbi:PHD finger protein ALFIN-LIKE 1 [Morus notabilis]|uniref:PHD finger protein ALFIN-LIKE n=1 Tax=Morus notabilis TaxID=981085 RepID=W9QYQ9_9ROSA|nr:PHD finger protein ALFIN-LIKE 1 [Morus notabilis]
MASNPRTVEEIFKDYSARRAGLVRALTYDVDEFYGLCDPDQVEFYDIDVVCPIAVYFVYYVIKSFFVGLEKENLCLYGHPNESWDVALPAEEVPPELPEPALGINFARDGMNRKDWLSLVAVHSDSWLLSVAFYFGARLNRNERKRLFSMINDLPTVFEVVAEKKPVKDKPSVDSGSKSRGSTKRSNDGQVKSNPKLVDESFEEEEDEHSETLCGSCGGNYNADEFWIGCDICEKWFHGKCVKITPAKAESIKQYKCPSCSMKRGRQYHISQYSKEILTVSGGQLQAVEIVPVAEKPHGGDLFHGDRRSSRIRAHIRRLKICRSARLGAPPRRPKICISARLGAPPRRPARFEARPSTKDLHRSLTKELLSNRSGVSSTAERYLADDSLRQLEGREGGRTGARPHGAPCDGRREILRQRERIFAKLDFLADDDYTFIGVGIEDDVEQLEDD